jgi:hypothetical protein
LASDWPELGAALGAPRGARMERRDDGASGSGPRSPRMPPPPPPHPAAPPPPLRPSQPQQPHARQPPPQQQPQHVHERLESRHGVFAARGGGGAAIPKKPKASPDTPCPSCGQLCRGQKGVAAHTRIVHNAGAAGAAGAVGAAGAAAPRKPRAPGGTARCTGSIDGCAPPPASSGHGPTPRWWTRTQSAS